MQDTKAYPYPPYQMGDELLILFSQALNKCFRANEVIARWGGDEH